MANTIAGHPNATAKRFKWAVVIVAAIIFVFCIYEYLDQQNSERHSSAEIRMPIANPQIEPTRPDLNGEPTFDEPE